MSEQTPDIGPADPEIPETPPPAGASEPEVEDQPLGTARDADPDEQDSLPGIPEGDEPPAAD